MSDGSNFNASNAKIISLSDPRSKGPSLYRTLGLNDPRSNGPRVYRTLGLKDPRSIGPSVYRTLGLTVILENFVSFFVCSSCFIWKMSLIKKQIQYIEQVAISHILLQQPSRPSFFFGGVGLQS